MTALSTHLAALPAPARALARLVPQVYLGRDAQRPDHPLARLLEVLGEPLADLDRAIRDLADDHFIELAHPPVLPLLAELVGAQLLGTDARTNRDVIASTVRWRRHAGTADTLTDMLTATTGWSTEVDEAYRSLLTTFDLHDPLRHRGRTATVTDPVALADPLSRPATENPAGGPPTPTQLIGRIGAADALRAAVSPRTPDLDGWVRPERIVIRTSRLTIREVDRQEVVHLRPVTFREDAAADPPRYVGVVVDPRGPHVDHTDVAIPFPLVGARPQVEPERPAAAAQRREPDPQAPAGRQPDRSELLTPTGLAADPAGAELNDLLTLRVDGVDLVGPDLPPPPAGPLPYNPPGTTPVLRFADTGLPAADEQWQIQLLAVDDLPALDTEAGDPTFPVPTAVGTRNPEVASSAVRRGTPGTPVVTDAGRHPVAGAQLVLRLRRTAAAAGQRAADGTWTALDVIPRRGRPLSRTVTVDAGGASFLARLERRPGGVDLALLSPDTPGATWQLLPVDLAGLARERLGDDAVEAADDGPWLTIAGGPDCVLVGGPVHAGPEVRTGAWRIDGVDVGAPVATRLDDPAAAAPPARVDAAGLVHAGRFWLHGGRERADAPPDADGARGIRADLWSIAAAAAAAAAAGWVRHRARHAAPRAGGRLVAVGGGLALLGGAERAGALSAAVRWIDPGAARPDWLVWPDLPLPPGPGTLEARADGAAVVVVAWADRTRPVGLRLTPGAARWDPAVPDRGATPNPPADGDAAFASDRLLLAAPTPLPPSEVMVDLGSAAVPAFLPAVDPADDGVELVLLDRDGSRLWRPTGIQYPTGLRLGTARDEAPGTRRSPAQRIGAPGRLGFTRLRLRQVDLTDWNRNLAIDLDDEVAVDPRLGRLLVRRDLVADGRLDVSYRFGRAAALGAGFAPPARELPTDWLEPPDPDDPERFIPGVPPDVDRDLVGGPAPVTARVAPLRVAIPGGSDADLDADADLAAVIDTPVVAALGDAVAGDGLLVQPLAAPARRVHVVVVEGSPRLEPATLTVAQGAAVSVRPAGTGGRPHVAADDGVSVTLAERLAGGAEPDIGPSWFLTGLSTDGAVELLVEAGLLDLRWCDLAPPRRADPMPPGDRPARLGLRVAGARPAAPDAGLPPVVGRRPTVVVRLVGCLVGGLALPPWVQLIAAGCTFDAGSDTATALDAAGASLRLRRCTVRGRVSAGILEASSSILRGAVESARPDLGWLRHCVLDPGAGWLAGRWPIRYQGAVARVSMVSLDATSPYYLLPDENNTAAVLAAGERGSLPGAHGDRTRSQLELTGRSAGAVPLGLVPHHLDRAAQALRRMDRRQT